MPTREEMWNHLGKEVDLLVVGGGIVGAGIARDAARRGLSVALIEKSDLASGTSSRSSKLVHGGLRYLETYEFSLVFESVSERRILMDIAPHLVSPLGFLLPVYKESRTKLSLVNAGMWLYDGLALFRSPKRHRRLKPAEVEAAEPGLRREGLKGAPLYYDCATDDARLTVEVALDAADAGAIVATWAEALSFVSDAQGRVVGVMVKNVRTGTTKEVRAKAVVNATGPWTDRTLALAGKQSRTIVRRTKGVHIVVDFAKLPVKHAVVCFHPNDARVLFVIPWGERAYIGTTDTDFHGDPSEVYATHEDVEYLLAASNAYFPEHPLDASDVISTWAGLRPLISPPETGVKASQVSREHEILVGENGLITIAGGKLTTFRRMAGEVVETVLRLLRLSSQLREGLKDPRTDRVPLPGAVGWPADDDPGAIERRVAASAEGTIGEDVAKHLTANYGTQALSIAALCAADAGLARPLVEGRPEILAQVDWAVNRELASTVSDVMMRRTQLYYRDHEQGLGAAPRVADRMAALIGWSSSEKARSLEAYEAEVLASRRWRDEPGR